MASGDIRGFYRQKKKQQKGGITKSVSASKKKKPSKSGGGATLGATDPQTPALFAHSAFDLTGYDYGEDEERLRQFDMDMRYGPCIGLTRLQRWERAFSMGLHPPADLRNLLSCASGPKSPDLECLWEGRV
ncbi:hypothetical protein BHE74_00031974 [Ensete ventricosum]|uniref:DNA polymerase delta subunit 4 n=1 Tax=Ensete ventricosum TaxID=4639 RepID=A0A426ZJD9_ENSVE|nr:hypothetical protein B296_00023020 [Ensete ventricosum]RWW60985.1 hypothetical protein BHE74_00031974 [Ensete ventricosum]